MLYGYARVSTYGQAKDGNSLEKKKKLLIENGVKKENIFVDAFTGTKIERPQFSKLLTMLKEGDTLIVCKLDRISRSASQGINLVDNLLEKGIKINILNMGLMDQSPNGKLIRNIFFSFAEFERDLIVMRTAEGKAIARQRDGYKEGRPGKDPKLLEKAYELKQQGKSLQEIREATGVCKSTLYRYIKEIESK